MVSKLWFCSCEDAGPYGGERMSAERSALFHRTEAHMEKLGWGVGSLCFSL